MSKHPDSVSPESATLAARANHPIGFFPSLRHQFAGGEVLLFMSGAYPDIPIQTDENWWGYYVLNCSQGGFLFVVDLFRDRSEEPGKEFSFSLSRLVEDDERVDMLGGKFLIGPSTAKGIRERIQQEMGVTTSDIDWAAVARSLPPGLVSEVAEWSKGLEGYGDSVTISEEQPLTLRLEPMWTHCDFVSDRQAEIYFDVDDFSERPLIMISRTGLPIPAFVGEEVSFTVKHRRHLSDMEIANLMSMIDDFKSGKLEWVVSSRDPFPEKDLNLRARELYTGEVFQWRDLEPPLPDVNAGEDYPIEPPVKTTYDHIDAMPAADYYRRRVERGRDLPSIAVVGFWQSADNFRRSLERSVDECMVVHKLDVIPDGHKFRLMWFLGSTGMTDKEEKAVRKRASSVYDVESFKRERRDQHPPLPRVPGPWLEGPVVKFTTGTVLDEEIHVGSPGDIDARYHRYDELFGIPLCGHGLGKIWVVAPDYETARKVALMAINGMNAEETSP